MTPTTLQTGDIVFFSGNSWVDKIVQNATEGVFNHVAIVVKGSLIESIGRGVVASQFRETAGIARLGRRLDDPYKSRAVQLLYTMIGTKYGVLDVVADGIKRFLPKALTGVPFLVAPSQFDCSALAVLFLTVAGYELPYEFYMDPHHVDPNSLAKALHPESRIWPHMRQ